jgi:hypothetical protein
VGHKTSFHNIIMRDSSTNEMYMLCVDVPRYVSSMAETVVGPDTVRTDHIDGAAKMQAQSHVHLIGRGPYPMIVQVTTSLRLASLTVESLAAGSVQLTAPVIDVASAVAIRATDLGAVAVLSSRLRANTLQYVGKLSLCHTTLNLSVLRCAMNE